MKNKLFILILIVCNLLTAYVSGEVPPAMGGNTSC